MFLKDTENKIIQFRIVQVAYRSTAQYSMEYLQFLRVNRSCTNDLCMDCRVFNRILIVLLMRYLCSHTAGYHVIEAISNQID